MGQSTSASTAPRGRRTLRSRSIAQSESASVTNAAPPITRIGPPPRGARKIGSSVTPVGATRTNIATGPAASATSRTAISNPAPARSVRTVSGLSASGMMRTVFIDDEASEGEDSASASSEVISTPEEESTGEDTDDNGAIVATPQRRAPATMRRAEDDSSDAETRERDLMAVLGVASSLTSTSDEDESRKHASHDSDTKGENSDEDSSGADDSGNDQPSSVLAVTPPGLATDWSDDETEDLRMDASSPIPRRPITGEPRLQLEFDNRALQSPTRRRRKARVVRISDVRSTLGILNVTSGTVQGRRSEGDGMEVDRAERSGDWDPFRMPTDGPSHAEEIPVAGSSRSTNGSDLQSGVQANGRRRGSQGESV